MAVSGATSYSIYWGKSSGVTTSQKTGITSNTYTHTGLTNGITYYYIVTAVNSAGESSASSETSATPPGDGLSISGDLQINENNSASYTATATYSDGSSETISPSWSEDSDYASVDSSGKVTTEEVSSDQSFTLTATYNGFTATKDITIKNTIDIGDIGEKITVTGTISISLSSPQSKAGLSGDVRFAAMDGAEVKVIDSSGTPLGTTATAAADGSYTITMFLKAPITWCGRVGEMF